MASLRDLVKEFRELTINKQNKLVPGSPNVHITPGPEEHQETITVDGGGSGDITRAEVEAMDAEVLNQSKLYTNRMIAVVKVDENQIINGCSVPKLTKDDLQALFNANQNGHMAIVRDNNSDNVYVVKQSAINEDDSQSVLLDYKGIMVLNYNRASGSDDVTTTYSLIGGGSGGDITRAEVEAMDAEVLSQAKEYSDTKEYTPIIIDVDENQVINSYEVPKLTAENLMDAYENFEAGYQVIISDATGNYNFAVKQADTNTEDKFIRFDFGDIMVLTYMLTDDEVATDYKPIGGGGEPEKFLRDIDVTLTEEGQDVSITDSKDVKTNFHIPNSQDSGWKFINSIIKVEDYLYYLELKNNDYDYAKKYFESHEDEISAANCTTICRDGILARNFDWLYDNEVSFALKTPYRYGFNRASIAIVSGFDKMNKQYVESAKYDDDIKVIPFFTTDGINDSGVSVSTHVLNDAYGDNKIIQPTDEVLTELYSLMLPRYILDTFTSATNAVNYIQQNVKVITPNGLLEQGYIQQFVVADQNDTYTLEPFDGEYRITHNKTSVVTNFAWKSTTPGSDGTLWTNADIDEGRHPGEQTGYQHKAMGVERYNMAYNLIKDETELDVDICKNVLNELNYTRLYDNHPNPPEKPWLSDYITTDGSLDACASHASAFDTDRYEGTIAYSNRSRETAETWQTVHSAIYDWENKKLYLSVQEQNKWHEFEIPWYSGELATVDYVDAQDELKLNQAKEYADTGLDTKSPLLEAGDNIEFETLSSGKIKVSSTGSGVTKEYVDDQDVIYLNNAKSYADTKSEEARMSANTYTDSEFMKLQNRIVTLENWMNSIEAEDLEYDLDGSATTISHLAYKSSE